MLTALLVSASGFGILLLEQNSYGYSAGEARIQSMQKTIEIDSNGDVRFKETTERYLDYRTFFQDLYFTANHERFQNVNHDYAPQFDTTRFSNRVLDTRTNDVLIEGDGTQEVERNVNQDTLKLSYSWLEDPRDENNERILPIDNDSVALFHYHSGYWDDTIFEYDYTIQGVALKFEDTAEFYWVVAATDDMRTTHVDVSIVLPGTFYSVDDVTVFLRGASRAHVHHLEHNQEGNIVVHIKADRLFPQEFITARILFPTEALNIITNTFGNDVRQVNFPGGAHIDHVLAYEQSFLNARQLYDIVDLFAVIVFGLLAIYALVSFRRLYLQFDKEHKSDFYGEFYRELPADYEPAIMGYLYRFQSIEKNDVSATLMDLIRRGYIAIDAEGELLTDKKANYRLRLTNDKDQKTLKSFEKQLITWFFQTVSKGKDIISLDELAQYTKVESQARRYMQDNQTFNRLLLEEGKTYQFFDDVRAAFIHASKRAGLLTLIGTLMVITRLIFALGTWPAVVGTILIGLGIGLTGYGRNIQRRSVKGHEDYVRWAAFENFLKSFSNIKDYPLPGIVIWEHYMVFAMSFGIADLVEQQLRFKYQQLNRMNELERSPYFRYPRFYYFYASSLNRTFTNASQTIAQAQANNSARGGGGRFGGGGGFTGGGGSGARLR